MIFPPPKAKNKNTFDNALIPLINVIFLLMVFFLVVGRIESTPDGKLESPQSAIGQAITGKPVVME